MPPTEEHPLDDFLDIMQDERQSNGTLDQDSLTAKNTLLSSDRQSDLERLENQVSIFANPTQGTYLQKPRT